MAITQTDLTAVLGDMTQKIADNTYVDLMKKGRRKLADAEYFKLDLYLMDYFIMSNWQQNADGTTGGKTNYITQAEFDQLLSVVRTYI